jgi:hypothetical protein
MDVCVVSKDKKPKCRTIKTKETSKDVVQSVREYKKIPMVSGFFFDNTSGPQWVKLPKKLVPLWVLVKLTLVKSVEKLLVLH